MTQEFLDMVVRYDTILTVLIIVLGIVAMIGVVVYTVTER